MTSAFATSLRAGDSTITSDIANRRARLVPGDTAVGVMSRPAAWPTRATVMVSTLVVLLLVAICSPAIWAQTQTPEPTLKVKPQFFTPKDRQEAIRKAAIYTPKAVAEVDIMAGPAQKKKQFQFHMNDKVTCEFVTPGQQMGGNTPKFLCKIVKVESLDGTVQTATDQINDDPLKVKFGDDNREVYAEIVSSRLLWALGFYTDAWYPIRVDCTNCPADPETGSGDRAPRTFKEASVVRKFDGHKMVETGKDEEGWSWKEFEELNGRPTYEKDGLKLMAAFISHSDNKPPAAAIGLRHRKHGYDHAAADSYL